jgi:hypothetical protein
MVSSARGARDRPTDRLARRCDGLRITGADRDEELITVMADKRNRLACPDPTSSTSRASPYSSTSKP